ncbi:MAG: hydrogenase subunit MbhD domain-containing protein [Actinomycetota bacterium]
MNWTLNLLIMIFLLATAIAAISVRDLLAAAVVFSAYSLMMAILWTQLRAPDLALTEAAVGAGVTTVLLVITIFKTVRREDKPQRRRIRESREEER